ncbi:hypothetical protein B9Z65_8463 [Elsinoe australis]|uniref:BTB domain-containing protein n=1 Tax=Elsinoe australis TaxID=40998 RepID=A0A2P7YDV6_9PEZI|nr:hypothetical protein B9Z65_8463 [Elsinoe australis]
MAPVRRMVSQDSHKGRPASATTRNATAAASSSKSRKTNGVQKNVFAHANNKAKKRPGYPSHFTNAVQDAITSENKQALVRTEKNSPAILAGPSVYNQVVKIQIGADSNTAQFMYGHPDFLARSSELLAREIGKLNGDFTDSNNTIILTSIDSAAAELFMNFIYSGVANPFHYMANPPLNPNTEQLVELYFTSHDFEAPSVANAIITHFYAERQSRSLFIVKHIKRIFFLDGKGKCPQDCQLTLFAQCWLAMHFGMQGLSLFNKVHVLGAFGMLVTRVRNHVENDQLWSKVQLGDFLQQAPKAIPSAEQAGQLQISSEDETDGSAGGAG